MEMMLRLRGNKLNARGRMILLFNLLGSWPAMFGCAPVEAEVLGVASVIDGDTIEIHGQRIRLFGIDTPEKDQSCDDAGGQPYRCGQKAAFILADFIGRSVVSCEEKAIDRYGRLVGRCFVRSHDMNGYMVRSGWALAYRRYASDYVGAEQEARNSRRGLWAGSFQAPWDFRHRRRERF